MTQDDLRVLIDKTDRLADQAEEAAVASRDAAGKLAAATLTLAEDQTERRKFEKLGRTAIRTGAWVIGVLTVLTLVAILLLVNLIQGRTQTRARIAATQAQTEEIARLTGILTDCTVAGGECYSKSQARTGAAVKEINDAALRSLGIVAVCRYRPTPEEFFSCVSSAGITLADIPGAPAPEAPAAVP